jgi:cytochrome c biogenesis protein CcmG/thiol:disulfide interchange protein DsbE
MITRVLILLSAVFLASTGFAAPVELPGGASGAAESAVPGQDLLINLPSDACGPASAAPCPTPGDAQGGTQSTPPGSSAKAFKLQDLDGKTYTFEPQGTPRPTLLIFWSLFCGPCKEEFPLYGQLAKEYAPKGLEVVAVNVDANLESARRARTAKSYLKMMKASLRVVLDRKEGGHFLAADPYGVTGTPSLYLVDRAGTIRWAHAGRVPAEELRAAIRQVLGQ